MKDATKKIRQPEPGSKQANLRDLRARRQEIKDAEIPKFCQVENRTPLPPDKQKRLAEINAKIAPAGSTKRDWRIPKGGLTPEGEAILAKQDLKKLKKDDEQISKLRATENRPPLNRSVETTADKAEPKAEAKPSAESSESKMRTTTSKKSSKTNASTSVKSKTTAKKPTERKASPLLGLLQHKNGVTNDEITKAIGRRVSASSMRSLCTSHDLKLKIVKKEGEKTRYIAA